jgi:predicted  nucleic acid-binding Zn-ribbon protein
LDNVKEIFRKPQLAGWFTMSEEIAPGIVFRRIHRELMAIHQCNEGLERLPRQLKAQQNRVAAAEKAKNDASELLKKSKVEQHQSEVSLKQLNALNEKYLRQQDEASDPKVFTALAHELASTKLKVDETENRILELMTVIDETNAKIPELDKAIAKAKAELATFEAEAASKKADLEGLLSEHKAKLATIEPRVPAEHSQGYLRGKKATFQDSLASVVDKTCTACQNNITTQMQNEIENHRFVTCKSCGRILYIPGND